MNFFRRADMRARKILCTILAAALLGALCVAAAQAPLYAKQTAMQKCRMARGAPITFTTGYALCDHLDIRSEALVCSGESVNFDEFKALYPDWQVVSFSSEGAALRRTLNAPCERHCLIRLRGSRLTLSRMKDGVLRELGSACIPLETLEPETIRRLEAGCLTDTLCQAEALIEDLES